MKKALLLTTILSCLMIAPLGGGISSVCAEESASPTEDTGETIDFGVMTHKTSIRGEPDLKSPTIRKTNTDEEGLVLEQTKRWVKLRFDDATEGWVPARLLIVDKRSKAEIERKKKELEEKRKTFAEMAVMKEATILRSEPAKSSPKARRVAKGDRIEIVEYSKSNLWIKLKFPNDEVGWTLRMLVTIEWAARKDLEYKGPKQYALVKKEQPILSMGLSRSLPVRQAIKGEEARVIRKIADKKWIKLRFSDDVEGWMPTSSVTLSDRSIWEPLPGNEGNFEKLAVWVQYPQKKITKEDFREIRKFTSRQAKRFSYKDLFRRPRFSKIMKETWYTEPCNPKDTECLGLFGIRMGVGEMLVGEVEFEEQEWFIEMRRFDVVGKKFTHKVNDQMEGDINTLRVLITTSIKKLYKDEKHQAPVKAAPVVAAVPAATPKKEKPRKPKVRAKKKKPARKVDDKYKVQRPAERKGIGPLAIAGWSALGTGVALCGLGGAGIAMAYKYGDDYEKNLSPGAKSNNKSWSAVAITSFSVGGALALAGAGLLIFDSQAGKVTLDDPPEANGMGEELRTDDEEDSFYGWWIAPGQQGNGFSFGLSGRW